MTNCLIDPPPQSRMASTSNQETFRADIDGRLVFDVLRHVLTAANLSSYSLEGCCAALLKRPLERLPPTALSTLLLPPTPPTDPGAPRVLIEHSIPTLVLLCELRRIQRS